MMLNVPYRQLLNYREELLTQSTKDYEKIKRAYISLYRKLELSNAINFDVNIDDESILKIKNDFISSMSNDFNTANAITAIFELTKLINIHLRNSNTDNLILMQMLKCLKELLWVLGIEVEV